MKIKKGVIKSKCNACGAKPTLDNNHKLATYIIKNPPKDVREISDKDKEANDQKKKEIEKKKKKKKDKKSKKKADAKLYVELDKEIDDLRTLFKTFEG